jgi:hypothetical protein
MPGTTQRGATVGYSLVLAPGWSKFSLREPVAREVSRVVGESVAALPAGVPGEAVARYRDELERRLTPAVARAARAPGSLDLFLPVRPAYGAPAGASFLIAEVQPDKVPRLNSIARTAGGTSPLRTRTIDGGPGFRLERTVGADPAGPVELPSRRVDYLLPVPGEGGRWLAVAFTAFGAKGPDDDIALLLTSLFDAMMENFRWQRGHSD